MNNHKKPCALLMNDVHVSKDNIQEFADNWGEALSICDKEKIPNLIIGGDLWQSRSSQTLNTLMAVRSALIQASDKVEVIIANGNHCKVDQESLLGYSHIFSQYPHVTVIDDFKTFTFDNLLLHVIAYFPETGSFKDKLNNLIDQNFDEGKCNILYIHEGVQGALGGMKLDSELPQDIFEPFDNVLVGHYHNRCKIKGSNIEYIGSSRQHNFGEDEEKGYTILYTDGSYEFVKNQVNARYMIMDLTIKQVNSDLIDHLDEIKYDGIYKVKTRINCFPSDISKIDKQKLLEAGATKVEIITEDIEVKEISSKSLDKKFDKLGIKSEYTDFCNDKEIEDVDFGLKYLDKIN